MQSSTERLTQLKPVSFHLKNEPKGEIQYGLIAEEVGKVYPELVIRDVRGEVQGVRYDELAPLLLSEVQQQQLKLGSQAQQIAALREALEAERVERVAQLLELKEAMQAVLAKVPVAAAQVAMR
jgi:hypothetical protein